MDGFVCEGDAGSTSARVAGGAATILAGNIDSRTRDVVRGSSPRREAEASEVFVPRTRTSRPAFEVEFSFRQVPKNGRRSG